MSSRYNTPNSVANDFSNAFELSIVDLISDLSLLGIDKDRIKALVVEARSHRDSIVGDILRVSSALPLPVQPTGLTSASPLRPIPQLQSPKKVDQELQIASSIIREVNKDADEEREPKSTGTTPRESIDKKWFAAADF